MLLPIAFTGLGFALADGDVRFVAVLGKAVGTLGVLLLALGAIYGAFAAGPVRAGGLNIGRLKAETPTLDELRVSEALVWHWTAIVAMDTAARRAQDLFQARRLTLLGVALVSTAVSQAVFGLYG